MSVRPGPAAPALATPPPPAMTEAGGGAPTKHPAGELLLEYATGAADLPLRILISAHATWCGTCRADIERLRAPGAGYIRGLDDSIGPSRALWRRLQAAIAQDAPARNHDAALRHLGIPLPSPAWAELGSRRALRWRSLFVRGIQWAHVASDEGSGASLYAVRTGKARALPEHLHTSREFNLVLQGGYADARGDYDVGDFVSYEAGSRHRPAMDPAEGCVALIRLEVPNRFLGWRGWFLR
jgi:putative transcriptional regulator